MLIYSLSQSLFYFHSYYIGRCSIHDTVEIAQRKLITMNYCAILRTMLMQDASPSVSTSGEEKQLAIAIDYTTVCRDYAGSGRRSSKRIFYIIRHSGSC